MLKLLLRAMLVLLAPCLIMLLLVIQIGKLKKPLTLAYVQEDAQGERTLVLHDVATGIRLPLSQDSPIYQIAWSPDGESLAVVHGYVADLKLSLNTLFGESRDLSSAYYHYAVPQFSPNGRYLLYNQEIRSTGVSLNQYDLQTGIERNLRSLNPDEMAWLPDSRYAVIHANFFETEARFALFDSENSSELRYFPTRLNLYERMIPHPDGESFILLAGWEIALLHLNDVDNPETLHEAHSAYTHAEISPNGRYLAFVSEKSPSYLGAWALTVMEIASRESQIILETEGILRGIAWSIDGEWLAYSFSPQGTAQNYREIYVVQWDGTGVQRIVSGYMANAAFAWRP